MRSSAKSAGRKALRPRHAAASVRDVDCAVSGNEFRLVYQPKYHARRGMIDSAEALVRWQHPHEGLMLPDKFITTCEGNGSIAPLTLWTVERSIVDQRYFRKHGRALRLFVNLSAQLLSDEPTIARLCEIAETPDIDIGLEITEGSVIADPLRAFGNIHRLRAAGYCIAIDDYGSGLSSLTYLKQIEADELKIDKSFVMSLGTSHRDPLIVRSTIDLAHALGMTVTAEGVETPAAQALLTVMGCDMMQGYLIGRPMRPPRMIVFLRGFDPATITVPNDSRVLHDHSFWKRA